MFQFARTLLKHGIAYSNFEKWCKKAFIDAAETVLAEQKKKITTSNVSALTSINRKDTKKYRELGDVEDLNDLNQGSNRAIRVITGWSNDEDYIDKTGEPAVLEVSSGDKKTFHDLVKKYSGDMTPTSMLEVLLESGNVEYINDQVKLVNKAFIPKGGVNSSEIIQMLGTDTASLIDTITNNMDPISDKHFQRKVFNYSLKPEYYQAFKTLSSERSQKLLEELNQWISEHQVSSKEEESEYVSLNIFFSNRKPDQQALVSIQKYIL